MIYLQHLLIIESNEVDKLYPVARTAVSQVVPLNDRTPMVLRLFMRYVLILMIPLCYSSNCCSLWGFYLDHKHGDVQIRRFLIK